MRAKAVKLNSLLRLSLFVCSVVSLSACNSLPTVDFLGLSGSQKEKDARSYAIKHLYCRADEPMPSAQALLSADQTSHEDLVKTGRDLTNIFHDFSHNKNCEFATKAVLACQNGFDRYDCAQGYVLKVMSFDNKNIDQVIKAKAAEAKALREVEEKKQAEVRATNLKAEAERKKAQHEAELERKIALQKAEDEKRKQQDINFNNALNALKKDPSYAKTQHVIMNVWDEKSRDEIRNDTSIVAKLNSDIKSGMYDSIMPFADAIRIKDGGTRSSLAYYNSGENALRKDFEEKLNAHVEQLASNEAKLDADLYWFSSQINERKLKLSKLKVGSKAYSELNQELLFLNNELIPLNMAKELIKQRAKESELRRLAQERDFQNKQLEQQRLMERERVAAQQQLQQQQFAQQQLLLQQQINAQTYQQRQQQQFLENQLLYERMSRPAPSIPMPSFNSNPQINCTTNRIGGTTYTNCR